MDLEQIDDIELMRGLLRTQIAETERLRKLLTKTLKELHKAKQTESAPLLAKLAEIEKQYEAALKRQFGPKSERSGAAERTQPKPPQKGHGPKVQPALPIKEVVHDLPESERECDLCGKAMEHWAGQDEESEEIDIIPAQVRLLKHRRRKYRCTQGCCVKVAPGPRRLVKGGRYSTNFALHVALQKYAYHQPLERQAKQLKRSGLDVTTATLWDYVQTLAKLLEPAYDRLGECVMQSEIIGVDETWWKLLKGETKGKSKTWWVWVRQCDLGVHYTLADSRGKDVANQLLDGFEGTVLCDGYGVYETLLKTNPALKLAHCWAHARREFLPLEEDPIAARCLRVIQRMYRLESRAKAQAMSPEELLSLRQRKTRRLLRAFFKWLGNLQVPTSGGLRKALQYVLKRQRSLMRFLDDPRIDPDNNATERTIRGVTLGRKNHYGSRSERGTQVAAIIYSMIESAERVGLNPHDYLARAVAKALAGEQIPLPHELL